MKLAVDFPQNVTFFKYNLACVAGGISVGVLYCLGGGATRKVGTSQFEIPHATIRGYFQ